MLIKSADDKSKRLTLLESLQQSPRLDRRQKDWLREELHRTRIGLAGERDAAHYLDTYLKDDPDRALLHDLRFEIGGAVLQIDHMVITRGMFVYLLETKNFNGHLHINEYGEFTVEYPGQRLYGIPSPLEQSRRHEVPLQKLFAQMGIRGRNGAAPRIHHCVLVHPKSVIHRPPADKLDTRDVIKADQFRTWHERFKDLNLSLGNTLSSLMNMRAADTIRDFAQQLVRRHRPADPLALPPFMAPRQAPPPPHAPSTHAQGPSHGANAEAAAPLASPPAAPRRKLICASCGSKITFSEGKFCWNNEARFGGLQYCREHQAGFH